jgi:hypothetical protein
MRITVQDVPEYLASGMSESEIFSDFPELTHEDILACLAFAADRERKLTTVPVLQSLLRLLSDQTYPDACERASSPPLRPPRCSTVAVNSSRP